MQDKTKIFNTALQLQIKGKFKEAQKFYLELIRKIFIVINYFFLQELHSYKLMNTTKQ